MTKRIRHAVYYLLIMISSVSLVISCDDDDDFNDSTNPGFPEFSSEISSAPGMKFTIEGKVADETGIANVSLFYPEWHLDKVIEFKESPKEYFLQYSFLTPEDEEPMSIHNIKVSVTDLGGNIATHDVVVTLDYDSTKPTLVFNTPAQGESFTSGASVPLNIDFGDNVALDSIKIENAGLGLSVKMKMEAGTQSYNYEGTIMIPLEDPANSYSIKATAIDATGNKTEKSLTITVGESGKFANIYLVGDSMQYPSDPEKAYKMWQDTDDENVWIAEFYYWTDYGVGFLSQLGWEPNYWGQDPDNPNMAILDANAGYINFPDGDGYYRIKFNPYSLEYTYEKMVVDIEVKSEMYIVGSGYPEYPNLNWSPEEAIPMDADRWGNPYVFEKIIEFSDDTSMKFLGQNNGWGPYDCGFEVGGEQQLPVNFEKNKVGDGTADIKFKNQAGVYWVTYDYFLNRTTIHPYNP